MISERLSNVTAIATRFQSLEGRYAGRPTICRRCRHPRRRTTDSHRAHRQRSVPLAGHVHTVRAHRCGACAVDHPSTPHRCCGRRGHLRTCHRSHPGRDSAPCLGSRTAAARLECSATAPTGGRLGRRAPARAVGRTSATAAAPLARSAAPARTLGWATARASGTSCGCVDGSAANGRLGRITSAAGAAASPATRSARPSPIGQRKTLRERNHGNKANPRCHRPG